MPCSSPGPAGPRPPSVRQTLLGLLVLWQGAFLLGANPAGLLGDRNPEGRPGVAVVLGAPWRIWGEWTGQRQHWSMFAPYVTTTVAFPAVEAKGGGAQFSETEPASPTHYFRPVGSFRAQTYETKLSKPFMAWDAEAVARGPEQWREHIIQSLERQRGPVGAYLQWQRRRLRDKAPDDAMPPQVVLKMRLYPVSPPGSPSPWGAVVELPAARLRESANGGLILEAYDPAVRRFRLLGETRP